MVEELGVLPKISNSKSMFHSIEVHNFWIDRNKQCPYCLNGSEPVHKSLIVEKLEKG